MDALLLDLNMALVKFLANLEVIFVRMSMDIVRISMAAAEVAVNLLHCWLRAPLLDFFEDSPLCLWWESTPFSDSTLTCQWRNSPDSQ